MKLGNLNNPQFIESFQTLLKLSLPAKTAYRLSKLAQTLEKENKLFQESKLTLIKKYAVKDEKGELITEGPMQAVTFLEEDQKLFLKEFAELCGLEVKINTLCIEDLGDTAKLETATLLILDELFADKESRHLEAVQ